MQSETASRDCGRIRAWKHYLSPIWQPPRMDIADSLGKRIAVIFGGFTRIDAIGGFVMADGRTLVESVYVFDVATNKSAADVLEFAHMAAAEIKRTMGQESIYFRNVDSNAVIL